MASSSISERQFEIIAAAGKILTTSGVSGLTIKNLAKAMKFSESAIYRHFNSKEDIVVAMLEYLAENMDERLRQVITPQQTPRESLEAMFLNQFQFFSRNPHFVVAVFSDGLMEASGKINERIFRIMQVKMSHLKPVLLRGQQQGAFTNNINTDELTHITMGTFRLLMFKWRAAGFQFDIEQQGKRMLEALSILITKST